MPKQTTTVNEDRVISTRSCETYIGRKCAAIDAQQRSKSAARSNPFFTSPMHQSRVQQVTDIVENFFSEFVAIYTTHRENKGHPFTCVKVSKPIWPAGMKQSQVDAMYRQPLKALGVEIILSPATNSYLYHIR